jgi:hypothetical protein
MEIDGLFFFLKREGRKGVVERRKLCRNRRKVWKEGGYGNYGRKEGGKFWKEGKYGRTKGRKLWKEARKEGRGFMEGRELSKMWKEGRKL